jgi:hypothetical protein
MVDEAELFNTLDDGGAGAAPKKMQEGDSPTTANGLIGFSFKDSSGNVVLPQLTADGKLPVTSDASGTCYYANGELAAGSLTLADITNASATIALTKEYSRIGAIVSCLHASLFQIVHTDDVGVGDTETVLGEMIVGPGQYTWSEELTCFILDTTGGTGVQALKLKGKNFRKLSSMRGSIAALEAG